MPHPQTRWPWAQTSTDTNVKKALLTRAIRANLNRAKHARDTEEQAYHLAWAQRLIKERNKL
ncbi:hypothetical protein [Rothia nasimurium]|uniref:hypothetical protein n=1 Tax=Rothia nasimurium TaxID=85336 RepID=UPI001F1852D5|nr:hypothetical protein [Rothia nasimurium]